MPQRCRQLFEFLLAMRQLEVSLSLQTPALAEFLAVAGAPSFKSQRYLCLVQPYRAL